jgi:hypothetical protein
MSTIDSSASNNSWGSEARAGLASRGYVPKLGRPEPTEG